MKTCLVFTGGGLPGLDIHAGIGMALSEAAIRPDEIHGTSAGAIYGALFAANDFAGISTAQIINGYNDDDVRDPRFMWRSRMLFINSYMTGGKMREIIAKHLPETFEELPCKLFTYTVESGSGESMCFSSGDLHRATAASASIRGVFPPVKFKMPAYTKYYSDGGTKCNVPLPSYWKDFDRVIVCVATQPVKYQGSGLITNLMLSVHELMEAQVDRVINEVSGDPRVTVIRPPVESRTGTLHFNHALISESFKHAKKALYGKS